MSDNPFSKLQVVCELCSTSIPIAKANWVDVSLEFPLVACDSCADRCTIADLMALAQK